MTRLVLVLFASGMLSLGCVPHRLVIPDPTVPHQVAKEARVQVWARAPDGKLVAQDVRILKGWWIAGPPVVEAEPAP